MGAVILSVRPVDERSQSVLGIYRKYGRPLFSAAESRTAHIILSEVGWLHEAGWPEDRGVTVPHLAKRERMTLNLLLEGWTRQRIAEHLAISLHTVQDYVKRVYRRFGVHSQAELVRRFHRGDGGDQVD